MARPKSTLKRVRVELRLPEALAAKLDLYLYSDIQKRVPYQAREELVSRLLTEFFDGLPVEALGLRAEG